VITVVGYDGALAAGGAPALRQATLVVGGARHLAAVAVPPGARTVAMGDVPAAVEQLAAHEGPAVVLASGDPGFFGIVRALRDRGLRPVVLPSVSSVAYAFARAGLPWDDAVVVSAHGRSLRRAVNACRARPKVAVLTGPGAGPAELGAALGGTGRSLLVVEDVGGTETVTCCSPEQAAARTWREPNVVLALDLARACPPRGWHSGPVAPRGWALGEDAFAHRDGMVTKAEVRALLLPRLAPRLGDLVWDVGCGSGSVAVECARLGAAAVGLDRDPAACALTTRNAADHGVDVTVVQGAAPDALGGLPQPDAAFVGGGGPAVVAAVAARGPRRVVVALAALERVGPTCGALRDAGYAVDGVQLQASRLATLPGGAHRLAAANPVVLVWGERS
jgi:precorrin-6Y C5,15-methyltransferase (decarboxylating)